MAKSGRILILVAVALGAAACTQTASGPPPGMTVAQGAAYCDTLTRTYGTYVGSVGGYLGGNATGGAQPDIDARVAIAQCQDGETGAAIPVLQRELRNNKVAVPPPPT